LDLRFRCNLRCCTPGPGKPEVDAIGMDRSPLGSLLHLTAGCWVWRRAEPRIKCDVRVLLLPSTSSFEHGVTPGTLCQYCAFSQLAVYTCPRLRRIANIYESIAACGRT